MMENPATWGEVEKIIDQAYRDWFEAREKGYIGYSLAAFIANRLREGCADVVCGTLGGSDNDD
jgi:hypothetical protein